MVGSIHFAVKIVQRSKGHSAVAAAAYRARMEITNERTGETWNYSRKKNDVLFAGIYAPNDAPEWMTDRAQLWNNVERVERYKTAQLSRDFTIALPHELSLEENKRLLTDFIRDNFSRKGYVADAAIHRPDTSGDQRNIHAHVQVTMRRVENGEFQKVKDQHNPRNPEAQQVTAWREAYAKTANRYLVKNGFEARFDHRSFKDQGVEKVPEFHLGKDTNKLERDGVATERGEELRAIREANRLREEAKALELAAANENRSKPRIVEAQDEQRTPAQSAVDRLKAEERAAQIETLREAGRRSRASLPDHIRVVLGALRSLRQTMSSAIADIVKGGDFFKLRSEAAYLRAMQEKKAATGTGTAAPPRSAEPPPRVADEQKKKLRDQFPEIKKRATVEPQKPRDPVIEQLDRMAAERKAAKLKEDAAKLALRGDLTRPTRKPKNDYER
jgi:hypothetical protein